MLASQEDQEMMLFVIFSITYQIVDFVFMTSSADYEGTRT